MKKYLLLILACILMFCSSISLSSGKDGGEEEMKKAGLGKHEKPAVQRKLGDIYSDQVAVSKRFLDFKKHRYIQKQTHRLFVIFMRDYVDKKESTLDITALS
jgi:hypothetical protein